MPQLRLMSSDAATAERTADAVVRALNAWPELQVGDVSVVANKRGPGVRVYIEVLLRDGQPSAGPEVTVERSSPRPNGRRRALPGVGEG